MPYELLQPRPLYKLIESSTENGDWVDGVYFEGDPTLATYFEFQGEWEPMSEGQIRQNLPEGINSIDAVIVLSEVILQVATVNGDVAISGDSIFLEDPVLNPNAFEYLVFRKAPWLTNVGFTLLDADSYDYICIRKELQ